MEAYAIGDGISPPNTFYVRPPPPKGAPSLLPVDEARAPDLVREGGSHIRIEYTGYAIGYRLWWLYHGDSRKEFAKLEFNPRHNDLDALHRDVEDAALAWVAHEVATAPECFRFFRRLNYAQFEEDTVSKTLCLRDFNSQNMDVIIQMLPECDGDTGATENEEEDLSEEEMDSFIDHCCDMVED